MMIDTHCHLSKKDYPDLENVIKRMDKNIMIVSGADMQSNYEVIELCKKYPNIYGTIGIHPSEVDEYNKENIEWIEKQLKNPKIVGIGEIGLDYHYEGFDKELQKNIFIEQITLAQKYHKPIVIHSRDAIQDTYDILKEHHVEKMKCVMHCYSSSLEMAWNFVKLGVKLGIGGVVTFKNAHRLVEVVREIPISSLLLETDSPYLTPEPYRGTRNEPYNIYYVAQKIAEIKNISQEKVLEETTKNAISQFDLDSEL